MYSRLQARFQKKMWRKWVLKYQPNANRTIAMRNANIRKGPVMDYETLAYKLAQDMLGARKCRLFVL